MTMQINIGDHLSPAAGFLVIPHRLRTTMRWARTRAIWIAKNKPAADIYYRTLPGHRSLTQLLADGSIWVNYEVSAAYGHTNRVSGKEIAISDLSFRWGRWTVLATLVHELAHSNGAPGGASRQAEQAVLACGLGNKSERTSGVDNRHTPYNPRIGG